MPGKIHIGQLIEERAKELNVPYDRLASRLKIPKATLEEIFRRESIDTNLLLMISKRLKFDFFRVYTGHMIIYSPLPAAYTKKGKSVKPGRKNPGAFEFRKNVYSPEIIAFFIEKIESGSLSVQDVMQKYQIPRTTIYRWCTKYIQIRK